jgi:hypothetical protein
LVLDGGGLTTRREQYGRVKSGFNEWRKALRPGRTLFRASSGDAVAIAPEPQQGPIDARIPQEMVVDGARQAALRRRNSARVIKYTPYPFGRYILCPYHKN